MASPRTFDLRLEDLPLERGGVVAEHHARLWWWGPARDLPALEARAHLLTEAEAQDQGQVVVQRVTPRAARRGGPPLDAEVPTVLLVHALTGSARAGGPGGWWEPLIGPGRVLDPERVRILCLNNLGSCYGSSGPLDAGFPAAASLTTVDQARAVALALDALGVGPLALAAGGSLGGMIALCLAALAPGRVQRLLPIGAAAAASAWVVGFNHVQREVLRLDPDRGLAVARQLAMLTYRSEASLELRQRRGLPLEPGAPGSYRVQGYLEHQGASLRARFHPRSYLALLDAMDSHDLLGGPLRLSAIRASTLVVDIDTDALFTPAQSELLAQALADGGAAAERGTLHSVHGHDGFLLDFEPMAALVARALALPAPAAPRPLSGWALPASPARPLERAP